MESITKEQLLAIMPNARKVADIYLPLLNRFAKEFGINTKLRWCHFLAQIAHESGEFRYTKELASGSAYEGRKDLGNVVPGDGVRFKGRGLIQITGRNNYKKYSEYCGVDLTKQPELLEKPFGATRSAFWFFCNYAKLLPYADADDIVTITRRINGGTNGLDKRKVYLLRAKLHIKE